MLHSTPQLVTSNLHFNMSDTHELESVKLLLLDTQYQYSTAAARVHLLCLMGKPGAACLHTCAGKCCRLHLLLTADTACPHPLHLPVVHSITQCLTPPQPLDSVLRLTECSCQLPQHAGLVRLVCLQTLVPADVKRLLEETLHHTGRCNQQLVLVIHG